MHYNLKTKTTENVYHTNNALTQQSRHGHLHWFLPFRLIFGRCFFCDSVFRRTLPNGWSGRREVLSGGAASLLSSVGWCRLAFSFFGWCCFFPLPLGGAAFLPILCVELLFTFLLLGCAAWPPPSFGSGAFLPTPFRMVFIYFLGTSSTQRRRRKAARPKEGGGQAATPAREERESRTTEREEEGPPLNWTELNFS